MPTLLEAAEVSPKAGFMVDGVSLASVLKGMDERKRFAERPLFWHYPHYSNQGGGPGSAVIVGDRKLIHWYYDDRVEAFDLGADPNETTDLAKRRPELVADLRKSLDSWRRQVDAKTPRPKPTAQ
jgi:arylsulfatase A-like enzyme